MTIHEFINRSEESFGDKRYSPGQRAAIEAKCWHFTERELNAIYSDLLETCKTLPLVAHIYASARSMNMLERKEFKPHRWQPSDCGLCRGEGRLGIIWRLTFEERPTGVCEIQELTELFQYTKSLQVALKPNHYRSIFRCRCLAGEADTIPKAWPKWSNDSNARREVWL